jgi:multiple sugar transport system ATP-binding protein
LVQLTLQNVVKIFPGGIRAVDDLSLDVAHGERIVLMGPSGCGKTTSLRLIAGLERTTSGKITCDGRDISRLPPCLRDVAMVFQHHALYPHLTVYGNLAFGLKLRRLGKTEIRRRVAETADVLGIAQLLDRKPWELSGGQRQRVALGRAIVRDPKIFLLDEPLSHLDPGMREQMRREIVRLQERLGTTMIYVTHDQTEAMTIGRRIAVLNAGRMQQIADPATLYNKPANRFVASMIGSPAMNFFPGRLVRRGDGLVFQPKKSPLPLGEGQGEGEASFGNMTSSNSTVGYENFSWPVAPQWLNALGPYRDKEIVLGIRPEHFRLEQSATDSDSLKIPATIEAIESLGADSHLRLRAGILSFICRTQSNHGALVGNPVIPSANQDHLYFFDPHTEQTIFQHGDMEGTE